MTYTKREKRRVREKEIDRKRNSVMEMQKLSLSAHNQKKNPTNMCVRISRIGRKIVHLLRNHCIKPKHKSLHKHTQSSFGS